MPNWLFLFFCSFLLALLIYLLYCITVHWQIRGSGCQSLKKNLRDKFQMLILRLKCLWDTWVLPQGHGVAPPSGAGTLSPHHHPSLRQKESPGDPKTVGTQVHPSKRERTT